MKFNIGFVGVGLMGHGVAKNILKNGFTLTIMGHKRREPILDLVNRGAQEVKTISSLMQKSEVVFLCLPSSVEVESIIYGNDGILENCKSDMILVDCTTADPNVTAKIATSLAEKGVSMLDAPLGRTPKEAEEGKLSTYVGGDKNIIKMVRPILECYTDTIIETGALGTGTTSKLVNNFISIGNCAVIAEAFATASKLGIDLGKLNEVISAGGANSAMFQMMIPWILEGDDSKLKGPLRIAGKDIRTYTKIAENAPATAFIAQAVNQIYQLANIQGHSEKFMPVLPGILAKLNGSKIRDFE